MAKQPLFSRSAVVGAVAQAGVPTEATVDDHEAGSTFRVGFSDNRDGVLAHMAERVFLAGLTAAVFGRHLITDELKGVFLKVGAIYPEGAVLGPVYRLDVGPVIGDDIALVYLLLELLSQLRPGTPPGCVCDVP